MAKEVNFKLPNSVELNRFIRDNRDDVIRYLSVHFCTYLREEDFEDIYQDSCVDLFMNINNGKLTELTCSLKSYLLRICINKTNKKLERQVLVEGKTRFEQMAQSRDPEQPGIDEAKIALLIGTTEDDCDKEECFSAIRQAVASIGEACKKILIGMYYDNLSHQDIADEMGYATARVVTTKANRCRNMFRDKNQHILEICRR